MWNLLEHGPRSDVEAAQDAVLAPGHQHLRILAKSHGKDRSRMCELLHDLALLDIQDHSLKFLTSVEMTCDRQQGGVGAKADAFDVAAHVLVQEDLTRCAEDPEVVIATARGPM